MDYEDIWLEEQLFPWLASDCMADQTYEPIPGEEPIESYYLQCMGCDAFLDEDEITDNDTCPYCNHPTD